MKDINVFFPKIFETKKSSPTELRSCYNEEVSEVCDLSYLKFSWQQLKDWREGNLQLDGPFQEFFLWLPMRRSAD